MPNRAWLLACGTLAAGSLAAWWWPAALLDWQPGLAAVEPWRAWTAAFVHWSPLHLGANLVGTALVAALGAAARLPPAYALAWAAGAWPLTHAGLSVRPDLLHYGGLSGVLHAGVAVVAIGLVQQRPKGRAAVGWAIAAGLAIKLLIEQPLGPPLRHPVGWDIAVAPLGHLSGTLAGALCGLLAAVRTRRRAGAASRHAEDCSAEERR